MTSYVQNPHFSECNLRTMCKYILTWWSFFSFSVPPYPWPKWSFGNPERRVHTPQSHNCVKLRCSTGRSCFPSKIERWSFGISTWLCGCDQVWHSVWHNLWHVWHNVWQVWHCVLIAMFNWTKLLPFENWEMIFWHLYMIVWLWSGKGVSDIPWISRAFCIKLLFFCFRSGNPMIHVQNLLLLLPSVRHADLMMRQFWEGVRRDGKVKLNKLLIEMLESNAKSNVVSSSET